jgi:GNAT superfamily N-acetyltransferase
MVTEYTSAEERLFREDQIDEFNCARTGIHDARSLAILLRDGRGRIYAGLSGHMRGRAAEVKLLWVDEASRHRGVGSGLLHAAEDEARARESTHNFHAPEFYRTRGYAIVGDVRDYPAGHSHILLEKALA